MEGVAAPGWRGGTELVACNGCFSLLLVEERTAATTIRHSNSSNNRPTEEDDQARRAVATTLVPRQPRQQLHTNNEG